MKASFKQPLALIVAMSLTSTLQAADIVDTAVKSGNFKTLVAAVDAAGLVNTLKGDGPFTVFAPTDEAFAKLPEGTVENLLKPENRDTLTAILTYHVVPGRVMAAQVVDLTGANTVNGQRLDIAVEGSAVSIDKARVTATDITCDNGVIHVIDSVLIPSDKTIPETAAAAKSFSTLLAAAKAAGLAETLGGEGPFTVFAPTDEAFSKLPAGTVESLLKPENKQKLVDLLKYHVVSGRVYSDQALQAQSAKTLLDSTIQIGLKKGVPYVNDSKLLKTDLDASNGVIHVIDSVLMPPARTSDASKMLRDAVAHGAPLYNAGHHAACAQIYTETLHTLMTTHPDSSVKHQVNHILTQARHQHCASDRAWTLRHGIDRMLVQMKSY